MKCELCGVVCHVFTTMTTLILNQAKKKPIGFAELDNYCDETSQEE